MYNPLPMKSRDSMFIRSPEEKSKEKHITFEEDSQKISKPPNLHESNQLATSSHRKRTVFNNRKSRRTAQSMQLFGNETVEEYFKRIDIEKTKKKNLIQAEIREQMMSLSQIFPRLNLSPSLRLKWIRVRTKLKLHVSMVKSHKEIKLYGLNYSKKGQERQLECDSLDGKKDKLVLRKYMFHPGNQFKRIWSFVLFVLLMYTAYITPVEIAFVDGFSAALNVVEYLVNGLFIIDMFVSMNSSYYDSNKQLVQSRRRILGKYIRGWFFIDLMAAFPFELVENEFFSPTNIDGSVSFSTVNTSNLKQLMKLPRIYRLFRLARLIKMVTKTKTSDYLVKIQEVFKLNSGFISLINYLVIISVAINFMGCVWFFEAKIRGFEPGTWVFELQLQDQEDYILYTYSVYWAIQTLCTVGYGDVHAFNMMERLICIIWMTFGAGFYSYSVGSLSTVITNLDTRKAKLRKKRIIMDEFCKENRIHKALHMKVRRALEYVSVKSLFTLDEKIEFLRELPTDLKYEISRLTRENTLMDYPFFKNRDKLFIAEFVLFLSPLIVHSGEIIFEKGQYPNCVYFITKGHVGLVEGADKMVYKYFVTGGYFGEIEIFANCERLSTAQALGNCELLTINRNEFELILNNFPDITLELRRISVEKRFRIEENLKNIQPLLSLNKRSPFWLKRRKTIRRVNHHLTKMFENPAFFMQQKPSITSSIFQMLKRFIPALPPFLRKNSKNKVSSFSQKKTLKEPEIVKAFCKSTNLNLVHAKNSTIIEFQELKIKNEIKNEIKSLRTKSRVLSTIPTKKAPKFFRFSNEMMLNLKGILKFQEKDFKKNKTSPNSNSNSKELPWQIENRKRSKSLQSTLNPEEMPNNANKTPEKFISMQNLRIQFKNEMNTPKAQDSELDKLLNKKECIFSESSDSPSNKKTEIKSNEKFKGTESPTSKNFLLVDKKEETAKNFQQNSEEKWKVLNQQAEEIMEKLKTANNNLLDLKKKLSLKKSQKYEDRSALC